MAGSSSSAVASRQLAWWCGGGVCRADSGSEGSHEAIGAGMGVGSGDQIAGNNETFFGEKDMLENWDISF